MSNAQPPLNEPNAGATVQQPRRSERLRAKYQNNAASSTQSSTHSSSRGQQVRSPPRRRARPPQTSRRRPAPASDNDLSSSPNLLVSLSTSPIRPNVLDSDSRSASFLAQTGPPPERRPRLESTVALNSVNRVITQPQPVVIDSIAEFAANLGITVEEYQQSLRAEQQINDQNRQIQQDRIIATRYNANPDAGFLEIAGMDPPLIINEAAILNDGMPRNVSAQDTDAALPVIVEEPDMCSICFEDQPIDAFICDFCHQLVGCRKCAEEWFNDSRKNQKAQSCPLCRHKWTKALFKKPNNSNGSSSAQLRV